MAGRRSSHSWRKILVRSSGIVWNPVTLKVPVYETPGWSTGVLEQYVFPVLQHSITPFRKEPLCAR